MGEAVNFEMEPEVRDTSGWVKFCSPSCAGYFVQKPEANRLRNDRDIAVWKFCIERNARGLGDWHWQLLNHVDGRSRDFAQYINKFDMSENVVT